MKYTIIHLSDIHCSKSEFVENKVMAGIDEINDLSPNLVVVSGDLTVWGLRSEFVMAKEVLSKIKHTPLIILMGNHDAKNVGYLIFEEYFGPRFKTYEDDFVNFIGVDSSQPDSDEGHIGRELSKYISSELEKYDPEKLKIFAMHHHLVPVPLAGRERDILRDAGDVLRMLIEQNVHLCIAGHRHIPWTWKIEDLLIVHAGTFGSERTRGFKTQSYNIINIKQEENGWNIEVILKKIEQSAEILRSATHIKR